jgi:hypothetical protein
LRRWTTSGPHFRWAPCLGPCCSCAWRTVHAFPPQVSPSKPFMSSRSGLTLVIFICEISYSSPINFYPVTKAKVASNPHESLSFCHRVIFDPKILKSVDKHTLLEFLLIYPGNDAIK